jgi:O-antigen/teichoic acid export membrane protein
VKPAAPVSRAALDGAVLTLAAEGLLLPTGLVTAALISRRLDAAGFGLFTLAVATVSWIEWTIASMFGRAAIRLIADAEDWRPLGSALLRVQLLIGCAAGAALWLLSAPLANVLDDARMADLLRLMALDLPFFCLAQAHRHILIGLGRYGQRAMVTAARWLARMILIVALVELGFGVPGAIAGNIAATVVELLLQRRFIQPPLWTAGPIQLGRLWEYSLPLFLSALSLRFYDRLDLFALKALGGTAEQAGHYGAAQRMALIPAMFGLSLVPLLISGLTRMIRDGRPDRAREVGSLALRAPLWLLPLTGIAAGAATGVTILVFGVKFAPAAPLLTPLLLAVHAITLIGVSVAILTAHGRPRLVLALTGPLLPLAVAGHILAIPRLGPGGAAGVTLAVAAAGALVTVGAAVRVGGAAVPWATALRSLAVSGLAFSLTSLWPAPGLMLLVKLSALALAAGLGLAALGEFGPAEVAMGRAYLRPPLDVLLRRAAREPR